MSPPRSVCCGLQQILLSENLLSRAAIWHEILLTRARNLWSNDYNWNLHVEEQEVPELRAKVVELFAAQVSGYRARLHEPRLLEAYDAKTARIVRDETAIARRRLNQLDIPFSIDARSMSYFNQRIAQRAWKDQQHGLRILHRDATRRLKGTEGDESGGAASRVYTQSLHQSVRCRPVQPLAGGPALAQGPVSRVGAVGQAGDANFNSLGDGPQHRRAIHPIHIGDADPS